LARIVQTPVVEMMVHLGEHAGSALAPLVDVLATAGVEPVEESPKRSSAD